MANEFISDRTGDEPPSEDSAPTDAPLTDGALDPVQLRLLVENSTDILCRMALDGTFVYLSPACVSMLGYEPDEMTGWNKARFIHPDDHGLMLPDLTLNPPPPDQDHHAAQYRMLRKDGLHLWVQTSSRLIRDEQRQAREVITIIRDVTRHKQAEDDLRHSERLASIGTLAAGIAHEINNPLGAILMAAHAAREAFLNKDQPLVEEMLDQIMADTRRAAGIVRSVLQFSRKEQAERVPANLRTIAMQVRHHALRYAGSRPVDIKVRGPDAPLWVLISPLEIEQTLVNLVNNSIDAGATRIHITVRTGELAGRVMVCVIDNGAGMTREQIAHAFDPFYTGRPDAGGTGLGLSIVQGIVVSHGGRITLSSQQGRGTTVRFDLPMCPPPGKEKNGA